MYNGLVIILILIIICLFYYYYYRYSYYNTSPVSACTSGSCEKYNVHQFHDDKKEAANLMQEVTNRNSILIEHLKNKYLNNHFKPGMDPLKSNRIDIVPESELSTWSAESMFDVNKYNDLKHLMESEYIQERVNQLTEHYNPRDIYEISPLNTSGVTSYTQDKKTLILCLRKKEKNESGQNELHDINTVMFVVIHELAHMANGQWGHGTNFWILFKFMLENAVECGIYKPVDYKRYPIVYCGLKLNFSPLFDMTL